MAARLTLGVVAAAALAAAAGVRAQAVPAAAPGAAAAAQDPGKVVRVFEIRYRDVAEVSMLIQPALSPAVLTVDRATRTVTVVDSPEVVRKVEAFLAQFDVPPDVVLVRIVLEKAQRTIRAVAGPAGRPENPFQEAASWTYAPLGEALLEVLERGHATHVMGEDGQFEVHVHVDSVDPERHLIRLDELGVYRLAPQRIALLSTSLDLDDRVGKTVMTARSEADDQALVVRVTGVIRTPREGGR